MNQTRFLNQSRTRPSHDLLCKHIKNDQKLSLIVIVISRMPTTIQGARSGSTERSSIECCRKRSQQNLKNSPSLTICITSCINEVNEITFIKSQSLDNHDFMKGLSRVYLLGEFLFYLLSAVPLPRFPENKCFGFFS